MVTREFNASGARRRAIARFDESRLPASKAEAALDVVQQEWTRLLALGFASPGKPSGGVDTCDVQLEPGPGGGNGTAGWVRLETDPLVRGDLIAFRRLVAHELFHGVQETSGVFTFGPALNEGTAVTIEYLTEVATNADPLGCSKQYLENPGETMWERPSPGTATSSNCSFSLWWLYFTEQLDAPAGPARRTTGVLRDLFAALSVGDGWKYSPLDRVGGIGDVTGDRRDKVVLLSPLAIGVVSPDLSDKHTHTVVGKGRRFGSGWRVRDVDEVGGIADVNGDGRGEIVLTSSNPAHIGMVGLDDEGNPTTIAVVSEGGRFGSGWKVRPGDRVVGVGDFSGSGRGEIVLMSSDPTYLGIVGLDDDGIPTTLATVPEGGRFGSGWKVRPGDRVVGVGDFSGNGRDEIVLMSSDPAYLGIVGLDDGRRPTTIVAVPEGGRFGTDWTVGSRDQVVGVGDFTGSGRGELVLQSSAPVRIGIVGLDGGNRPATRAVVAQDQRFGRGWKVRAGDQIVGVGDFLGNGREQLVMRNPDPFYVGVVGLDERRRTVTHAVQSAAQSPLVRKETEFLGVGDFAGDGRSKLLIRQPGASANLEVVDLNSELRWRLRFYISEGRRFDSLIRRLDRFIRERTGRRRSFESMWVDFTVANLVKDLKGARSQHRYRENQPATTAVAITASVPVGGGLRDSPLERWAAAYIAIPPEPTETRVGIVATQPEARSEVAWSLVVSNDGDFKSLTQRRGVGFTANLALRPRDRPTLIVTTFGTSVRYSVTAKPI